MSKNFLNQEFGSDDEEDDFNPAPVEDSDNEVKVGSKSPGGDVDEKYDDAEYKGEQSENDLAGRDDDDEYETKPSDLSVPEPRKPDPEDEDDDNGDAEEDEEGGGEDEDDEEEDDEDEDDEDAVSVSALVSSFAVTFLLSSPCLLKGRQLTGLLPLYHRVVHGNEEREGVC